MFDLLLTQARKAAFVVRLRPFDPSTPQERSQERYRRIFLTTLASAAARGVSILATLISVPLTLDYLGTERYALWMTINSFFTMLAFADLGMGNGLLNAVSEAHGKDDREAALRYVSSGFFALSGLAGLLAIGFAIIYPSTPWPRVFNVSSPTAVAEAGLATAIFVSLFFASMPLGVSQRVQLGYQEGFINSLWEGLGHLLGLGGVVLAVYLKAGLPWLVLARAGAPALAALLNSGVLFWGTRPWLRPRWQYVTGEATGKIMRLGFLFFVLQLAAALVFSSDNLVAAQVVGPDAVAQYSVPAQMFNIAPILLLMGLSPLWPAYGEAIARGDMAWVRRALGRSLALVVVITGPASILLTLFGARVVKLWVGPNVTPSFLLLLGLGIWMVMQALGSAVAMFLNGVGLIKFQAVMATVMAVSALVMKVLLARLIGTPGIVWGTLIAYAICVAIPCLVVIPRLLSTLSQRASQAHAT